MHPVGYHIRFPPEIFDKDSNEEDTHNTSRISLVNYGHPAFLRSVLALHPLKFSSVGRVTPWKYEMRQQAQAIVPFLYLGAAAAAKDIEFLQRTGITFLLAVRPGSAWSSFMNPAPVAAKLGIESWTLDAQNAFEVRKQLMTAIARINKHLEQSCAIGPASNSQEIRGKILVCCETGNDRSATLVAAYLIVMYDLDAPAALALIQSKRFCLSPTDSMKDMLTHFRSYVQAQGQVAIAQQADQQALQELQTSNLPAPPTLQLSSPRKRQLSDPYEETMMENKMPELNDNLGGLQSRGGQAPFADV